MDKFVTVKELMDANSLSVVAGENGLDNKIGDSEITLPELEFAGFLQYFDTKRVILIGSRVATYLIELGEELAKKRAEKIFTLNPHAIVFSRNVLIFSPSFRKILIFIIYCYKIINKFTERSP